MKKLIKIAATLTSAIIMLTLTACVKTAERKPRPYFEDEYTLHNWYATVEDGAPKITISNENYTTIQFPVPEREHFTFNGWYLGDEMVADENGNSVMTKTQLHSPNYDIYAKWTANEQFTYKLLLVYVTRIEATLYSSKDDEDKVVDYTMSETEREFCKLTTKKVKQFLDDGLDGLVDFQVDEYFTTQTVVTENFVRGGGPSIGEVSFILNPPNIPEVSGMLSAYDSALTILNREDYDYKLHSSSGSARAKYGRVYFDSFIPSVIHFGSSLENFVLALGGNGKVQLSSDEINLFNCWIDTIAHELTHTIEMRINAYEYHDAISLLAKQALSSDVTQLYLGNQIKVDGEFVGIPYEFWAGELG